MIFNPTSPFNWKRLWVFCTFAAAYDGCGLLHHDFVTRDECLKTVNCTSSYLLSKFYLTSLHDLLTSFHARKRSKHQNSDMIKCKWASLSYCFRLDAILVLFCTFFSLKFIGNFHPTQCRRLKVQHARICSAFSPLSCLSVNSNILKDDAI